MRESTGRALRINELRKFITETNGSISEKKLISLMSLKWNTAERKVKEYLNLLINVDFCERVNDSVKIIKV